MLPILGKILEKILFNSIFEYLQKNNFLCENQSGFRPYDSILVPLFFLIYINDLTKGISSTAELFADDTSIFSVVNVNVSSDQMNKDLEKISMCVCQWKMSFNPDISKQAQEITFSKKNLNVYPSPSLLFTNCKSK